MKTRRIHAVYFSPAGATRRLVEHLANALGDGQAQVEAWDFTLPAGRVNPFRAEAGEVVVAGMPDDAERERLVNRQFAVTFVAWGIFLLFGITGLFGLLD